MNLLGLLRTPNRTSYRQTENRTKNLSDIQTRIELVRVKTLVVTTPSKDSDYITSVVIIVDMLLAHTRSWMKMFEMPTLSC